MKTSHLVCHLYTKWQKWHVERMRIKQLRTYVRNGRRPYSEGYSVFKEQFIRRVINDGQLMETFRNNQPLPERYGEFLDERVVEYPWLLSRISMEAGKLLDAGSSLNFDYILGHSTLRRKDITIVTLEPESNCFWQKRISYFFGDIRCLPFRDNYFDDIVSISTLEHVGMDNTLVYTSHPAFEERNKYDFLKALAEIKRVVKPGGTVYITVPYGIYTDFGWYSQFSTEMVDLMINTFAPADLSETYFCYELGGWSVGDKYHCQEFEGFDIHKTKYFDPDSTKDYDPDYAASSRAIAALEFRK